MRYTTLEIMTYILYHIRKSNMSVPYDTRKERAVHQEPPYEMIRYERLRRLLPVRLEKCTVRFDNVRYVEPSLMMEMQRSMLLDTSIQPIFQIFLRVNSNSNSTHLSFCYEILVHLSNCVMEHTFMSPTLVRESLNAKFLEINMLTI